MSLFETCWKLAETCGGGKKPHRGRYNITQLTLHAGRGCCFVICLELSRLYTSVTAVVLICCRSQAGDGDDTLKTLSMLACCLMILDVPIMADRLPVAIRKRATIVQQVCSVCADWRRRAPVGPMLLRWGQGKRNGNDHCCDGGRASATETFIAAVGSGQAQRNDHRCGGIAACPPAHCANLFACGTL